jgi:steroid delta-isomerase-like uncharacterized protein
MYKWGLQMMRRRNLLALAMLTGPALLAPRTETLAADCSSAADAGAVGSLLLDKYAAAVNAHDTGAFPDLFAEAYIQHSGRSASGLAAQIENFRRIFSTMPDIRMQVEDRVIAGDRVAARNAYSATHTQTIRGIPPTGKSFTFRAFDFWRVENGKFAEHWDLTDTAEVLGQLRRE